MFSKNNRFAMERKMSASKQRFGLRKIMGGVASVLLGLTFLYGTRASADEVQPTETVTTSQLATAPTHSELTVPATANPVLSTATTGEEAAPVIATDTNSEVTTSTPVTPVATPQQPVDSATTETANTQQPATAPAPTVSAPAEEQQKEHQVQINFVTDWYGNTQPVLTVTVNVRPGTDLDLSQFASQLPTGLKLNHQWLRINHSDVVYQVKLDHELTENYAENKEFVQNIYGVVNGQQVLLGTQTITLTRYGVYDHYTNEFRPTTGWQLNGQEVSQAQFADFTVNLTGDLAGYSAENTVVTGAVIDPNGDQTVFNQYVNLAENIVKTENRTIKRLVTVYYPDGSHRVITQLVTFTRTTTYNPFTQDQIADTGWSYQLDGAGDWVQGDQVELPAIDLPEIDGKKPAGWSGDGIGQVMITPESQDMAAKVWYEATLVYQHHENQDVNRVIHHHYPDGRVEQVTHTASFTRPVYLNLQTNLLEYGDWEGPAAFDDYLVPELAGHTTSVDKIAGAEVKPGDADHVHHVYYTLLANPDDQPGNSDSDTDQPTGSDTDSQPGAGTTAGNTGSPAGGQQSQPAPVLTAVTSTGGEQSAQPAAVSGVNQEQQAALPATGTADNQAATVTGAVILGLVAQLLTFGLLRRKKVNK
ncbi:mucin-binding protein [Limosilactobacillus oris]|uniref:mucin-binding protein n=1 Tax=Limosilactobacillus oris TaxID=1632 RepID=UPI0022364764|nr:YSIRK-type signal peptide-containing protein [Limosilactobacillus oris]MCW4387472.1 YSIRK-type signal peptide-containing protein [Limosilactobacillus oris]